MRRTAIIPKTIYMMCITTVLAVVMSFSAIAQPLQLHFRNVVDGKPVALEKDNYKNGLGQSYTVSNLKYYISNIQLTTESGKELTDSDYYLIREDDSASMNITLPHIPIGHYTRLTFSIGVDSLHNCSGAQSDALDPVNGMFWTWNTGYIFFKLEGKSSASKNPGSIYEYHIGGYKAPANCIRSVSIDLTGISLMPVIVLPPDTFHRELKITGIDISADISKFMNAATPIDLTKISSVTDFHNATQIADHYQQMFSLIKKDYGY